MKLPRVTILKLVVFVAVVAVNLAVARASVANNVWWFFAAALGVVALQIGGFRLIRKRGSTRVFWVGFVVTLSGALFSLGWVIPYLDGPTPDSSVGRVVGKVWISYLEFGFNVVRHIFRPWTTQNPSRSFPEFLRCLPFAVVFFLPQLVAAIAGGLIFRRIAVLWGRIHPVPAPPAPSDNDPSKGHDHDTR